MFKKLQNYSPQGSNLLSDTAGVAARRCAFVRMNPQGVRDQAHPGETALLQGSLVRVGSSLQ